VLADGMYQSTANRQVTKVVLGAKLLAPINPRNHKDKPVENDGIEKNRQSRVQVRSRVAVKFEFTGDNAIAGMAKMLWSGQP
jgi:hypothetical protein